VAVVLTIIQTKQIRINIHKRNNTKNTVQTIQNTVQIIQNKVQTIQNTVETIQNTVQTIQVHISKYIYSKAELGERDGEGLKIGRKNKRNEKWVR
jgi:peptidoglycan hydrolase CwlO-like protein